MVIGCVSEIDQTDRLVLSIDMTPEHGLVRMLVPMTTDRPGLARPTLHERREHAFALLFGKRLPQLAPYPDLGAEVEGGERLVEHEDVAGPEMQHGARDRSRPSLAVRPLTGLSDQRCHAAGSFPNR